MPDQDDFEELPTPKPISYIKTALNFTQNYIILPTIYTLKKTATLLRSIPTTLRKINTFNKDKIVALQSAKEAEEKRDYDFDISKEVIELTTQNPVAKKFSQYIKILIQPFYNPIELLTMAWYCVGHLPHEYCEEYGIEGVPAQFAKLSRDITFFILPVVIYSYTIRRDVKALIQCKFNDAKLSAETHILRDPTIIKSPELSAKQLIVSNVIDTVHYCIEKGGEVCFAILSNFLPWQIQIPLYVLQIHITGTYTYTIHLAYGGVSPVDALIHSSRFQSEVMARGFAEKLPEYMIDAVSRVLPQNAVTNYVVTSCQAFVSRLVYMNGFFETVPQQDQSVACNRLVITHFGLSAYVTRELVENLKHQLSDKRTTPQLILTLQNLNDYLISKGIYDRRRIQQIKKAVTIFYNFVWYYILPMIQQLHLVAGKLILPKEMTSFENFFQGDVTNENWVNIYSTLSTITGTLSKYSSHAVLTTVVNWMPNWLYKKIESALEEQYDLPKEITKIARKILLSPTIQARLTQIDQFVSKQEPSPVTTLHPPEPNVMGYLLIALRPNSPKLFTRKQKNEPSIQIVKGKDFSDTIKAMQRTLN